MKVDYALLDYVKRLMLARYPRFGAEIAGLTMEYKTDLKYHTAATDGKTIYFDPNYLASLTDDEKLFIIAHEIMHIKFEHMFRLKDKKGQIRDPEVWNTATDAIINANLKKDGFTIKEGYVDIPEAINFTSEQLYDILYAQKQAMQQAMQQSSQSGEQSQEGQQGQEGQGQDGQGQEGQEQQAQRAQNSQSQNSGQQQQNGQSQNGGQKANEQSGQSTSQSNPQGGQQSSSNINDNIFDRPNADDHSLWEKAFEESQEVAKEEDSFFDRFFKRNEGKNASNKTHKTGQNIDFEEVDENAQFQENRRERHVRARQRINEMRRNQDPYYSGDTIDFGDVGTAKPILDWKQLLRREVEKDETVWSQRRSIAENNYAYRLEENEVEDEAETEVMIDVSGSVSLDMVKAFLRQLKPIVNQSKLKVGCFNEKYWGMVEVKTDKDIDKFKIPESARGHSAWTEDWDLAVRSFSKKREVNKIVFTDGEPCPGTMPKEDLRGTNVIWLVYSNREFDPCCGTVIQISPKDLEGMQNLQVQEPERTM